MKKVLITILVLSLFIGSGSARADSFENSMNGWSFEGTQGTQERSTDNPFHRNTHIKIDSCCSNSNDFNGISQTFNLSKYEEIEAYAVEKYGNYPAELRISGTTYDTYSKDNSYGKLTANVSSMTGNHRVKVGYFKNGAPWSHIDIDYVLLKEEPGVKNSKTVPQTWEYNEKPDLELNISNPDNGDGNFGTYKGETLHNGSINGASWTTGKYGEALSFDGQNDDVVVSNNKDLNLRNFTYTARLKTSDADMWFTTKGSNYLSVRPNGQHGVFFGNCGNSGYHTSTSDVDDGSYHQVAYQVSGSTLKIYTDGQKENTVDIGSCTATFDNTDDLVFSDSTFLYNGSMDDVRLYNRSLSSSEISSIYENNTFYREDLVGYWRMDRGSGGTAYDTHHRVSRFNAEGDGGVSFDGVDDQVRVDDNSNLDVSEVTLFFRLKGEGSADYTNNLVVKQNAYRTYYSQNGDNVEFNVFLGGSKKDLKVDYNLSDSERHNVTATFDGSQMLVNIDDQDIGTKSVSGSIDNSTKPLYIGGGTFDEWKGEFYSACVYDRALSDSEISKLNSDGCMSVQKGLVASYQFENATERPEERQKNILDYSIIPSVKLDVLEDGTSIVSDAFLELQSWYNVFDSHKYSISDAFNIDEANVFYNATLTALDKTGLSDSVSFNQKIQDLNPVVSLNKPSGDKFDYDLTYKVTTSDDNDDVPNEDLQCTVSDGQGTIDTFTVQEGGSKSGNFRRDFGSYSLSLSCTEQKGDSNTGSDSKSYSVSAIGINSVSSPSPVFENENTSYSLDYRTGDMIHEEGSTVDLYWRNSKDSYGFPLVTDANGLENFYRTIPLVQSNGTQVDWRLQVNYNVSKLGGGYEIRSVNSSQQNQEILFNYYFGSHSLENGFTQLEASTLNYTSRIVEETQSTANINVDHSYGQTGETREGLQINRTSYYNLFDSDLINSTSASFDLEANYTVAFNGDTRRITDNKTVTLDKIVLNKNQNGAETFKLKTRDETNNTLVNADVAAGIQVNNPDQPGKTRFYGFDFAKGQSHSVYLEPSYAEINANVFDKRSIEYSNTNKSYPERRYYLTDTLLDDQTTNINLYLLKASEGSTVRLELVDDDLKDLEQHLIRIERAFPDKEETRTVALAKTGGDGFASTFLKLQEQYIFTVFNSEGELVDQIGPQSVTSSTERLVVEDDVPPSFANAIQQVKFTDIQEENQSLSVSYVSETDRLNHIYLDVYQDNLFGSQLISSDSSEQVQGRLEASGFNTSEERVFYELTATFGETNITLETGVYGQQTSDYGDAGIFVSFLMFMALTLSGLFRPSAAIGLGVVSIFVMAFTGLLAVGQTALISLAALAAVLIWRMSN